MAETMGVRSLQSREQPGQRALLISYSCPWCTAQAINKAAPILKDSAQ